MISERDCSHRLAACILWPTRVCLGHHTYVLSAHSLCCVSSCLSVSIVWKSFVTSFRNSVARVEISDFHFSAGKISFLLRDNNGDELFRGIFAKIFDSIHFQKSNVEKFSKIQKLEDFYDGCLVTKVAVCGGCTVHDCSHPYIIASPTTQYIHVPSTNVVLGGPIVHPGLRNLVAT